jgi:hypothetical protein
MPFPVFLVVDAILFDLKRSHNWVVRKQILLKAILQMFGVLYSAAKARPACYRMGCVGEVVGKKLGGQYVVK